MSKESKRCKVQGCKRKKKGSYSVLCSGHKFRWNEYLNTLTTPEFNDFLERSQYQEDPLFYTWVQTQGSLNK